MSCLSTRAKHVQPVHLSILSLLFLSLFLSLALIFIAPTSTAIATDEDIDTMSSTVSNTMPSTLSSNIIGGEETPPGAYPWMVGIIDNDNEHIFWAQYCGGTIVHPQWILTAAHCTYTFGRAIAPSDIDILVGQDELRATTGQRIAVEQIIRHPGYDQKTGDTDIALLKLAVPTTQPTVRMANSSMIGVAESNAIGTVLGWGRTSTGPRVNHLHQVNVPLVASKTCTTAYELLGYTMTANMLCAGYQQGGYDACSGDSGGPLVIREIEGDEGSPWIQVGIISWGKGCAQANAYGVYTHIARFKDWVDVQIALNSSTTDAGSAVLPPTGQSFGSSRIFMPIFNHIVD